MTAITINDKNRAIELSNTFSKAAFTYGTDAFDQLQDVRHAYPNYRVVTIRQKRSRKDVFANLSFSYMDKYVQEHADDSVKAKYRDLRSLDADWKHDENGIPADYHIIKDWFLNTFPEFEQFRADRLALVEKIKREKEARLAARKKAV